MRKRAASYGEHPISARHCSFLALLIAAVFAATPGFASCRLALALGLDVSDSVDATEYRLQLDGLAAALTQPDVITAFMAIPQAPVRLFVFEWAGQSSQRRIIEWRVVESPADLESIAQTLRERPRFDLSPSTGLGAAMLYGGDALVTQSECQRHVLDISGDGKSNTGVMPRDLGPTALPGITVNGLVVGTKGERSGEHWWTEIVELHAFYVNDVIRGPGAFAMIASSFQNFEEAMARKLLRELQSYAVAKIDGRSAYLSERQMYERTSME